MVSSESDPFFDYTIIHPGCSFYINPAVCRKPGDVSADPPGAHCQRCCSLFHRNHLIVFYLAWRTLTVRAADRIAWKPIVGTSYSILPLWLRFLHAGGMDASGSLSRAFHPCCRFAFSAAGRDPLPVRNHDRARHIRNLPLHLPKKPGITEFCSIRPTAAIMSRQCKACHARGAVLSPVILRLPDFSGQPTETIAASGLCLFAVVHRAHLFHKSGALRTGASERPPRRHRACGRPFAYHSGYRETGISIALFPVSG